jgi:hypothetical protein
MFLRNTAPAFAWATLIFILCSLPGYAIPHYSWTDLISFDKFIHAFLFAVLIIFLLKGFNKQNQFKYLNTHPVLISFLVCVLYGGALELMQNYFFIDRTGDWFDFIANSVGCLIGIPICNSLKKKSN